MEVKVEVGSRVTFFAKRKTHEGTVTKVSVREHRKATALKRDIFLRGTYQETKDLDAAIAARDAVEDVTSLVAEVAVEGARGAWKVPVSMLKVVGTADRATIGAAKVAVAQAKTDRKDVLDARRDQRVEALASAGLAVGDAVEVLFAHGWSNPISSPYIVRRITEAGVIWVSTSPASRVLRCKPHQVRKAVAR